MNELPEAQSAVYLNRWMFLGRQILCMHSIRSELVPWDTKAVHNALEAINLGNSAGFLQFVVALRSHITAPRCLESTSMHLIYCVAGHMFLWHLLTILRSSIISCVFMGIYIEFCVQILRSANPTKFYSSEPQPIICPKVFVFHRSLRPTLRTSFGDGGEAT